MPRLIKHNRSHTGEKKYSCDLCEKKNSQISGLNTHKRLHTGEKPYQCDLCEKTFSDSSHFRIHKRYHTGEKPFSCNLCQKSYYTSSELTQHLRSAKHRKKFESTENTTGTSYFPTTNFVDCSEADIKHEIKEEEMVADDFLSIKMETENDDEAVKQETKEEVET